jgi:hypothetical protein
MSEKHCVHYSYVGGRDGGGPVCAVKIDIRANFRPLWPCISGSTPPESSAKCPQFLAPTVEQLAEQQRQGDEAVNRGFTALRAIEQWEKAHGVVLDKAVAISCPCCYVEDALRFVRSIRHLVAKCSTPKCVEFRGSSRR